MKHATSGDHDGDCKIKTAAGGGREPVAWPETLDDALDGLLRCAVRLKRIADADAPPVLIFKEAELIEARVAKARAFSPTTLSREVLGREALDKAWEKINSLGGYGSTAEELAYIYGIENALSAIEELGGMNPDRRPIST